MVLCQFFGVRGVLGGPRGHRRGLRAILVVLFGSLGVLARSLGVLGGTLGTPRGGHLVSLGCQRMSPKAFLAFSKIVRFTTVKPSLLHQRSPREASEIAFLSDVGGSKSFGKRF